MSTLRICLWSGPRNVSTALMYSFAQRVDTRVVDEPLYAHYLTRTGIEHPGREEILAAQDSDGEHVVRDLILGACDHPVLFMKQMAHHADGIDWGFLAETVNVFLIREPEEMLTSLMSNIPEPELSDTGLELQTRLYGHLRELGQEPIVLDARLLLTDPSALLERLCRQLQIAWDPGMLHWTAGPRVEDGVWANHWYTNVHQSVGFSPYRAKSARVPSRLQPLLELCREHYNPLMKAAETFKQSARH